MPLYSTKGADFWEFLQKISKKKQFRGSKRAVLCQSLIWPATWHVWKKVFVVFYFGAVPIYDMTRNVARLKKVFFWGRSLRAALSRSWIWYDPQCGASAERFPRLFSVFFFWCSLRVALSRSWIWYDPQRGASEERFPPLFSVFFFLGWRENTDAGGSGV